MSVSEAVPFTSFDSRILPAVWITPDFRVHRSDSLALGALQFRGLQTATFIASFSLAIRQHQLPGELHEQISRISLLIGLAADAWGSVSRSVYVSK
jgi:hypothetical protein